MAHKAFTIIGDTPRVDLITTAHRVNYEEASKTALKTTLEGVKIPYVDYPTLITTKSTGRLQDKADIENLKKIRGNIKS